MSNKTTTSILEYAEVHRDFSMDDLFAYLHEKVGISKSSLSWLEKPLNFDPFGHARFAHLFVLYD